jgi:Amt family ammonium transporter
VSRYDCVASCSGFIGGLVAISGVCDQCEPYGALIIGITSSLVYVYSCKLLDLLHIDDPVEVISVNLFCGIWGTLMTAFFDNEDGLFYNGPHMGKYLGV